MPDKIIEVPGYGNVAFPSSMSDDDIGAVIQRQIVQTTVPPMPKAPIPSELQSDSGPATLGRTYLQNFVDKLHGMAEVAHDLNTAVSTGDWKTLQKKYPPLEAQPTVSGLAQTAGAGYKSAAQSVGLYPEFRTDPRTGEIDPWATVGATLSNLTMGAAGIGPELRGINEEFPTPPRPPKAAPEAAAAEAAPKLTLAQKYPKAATNLARVVGGGVVGGVASVLGPYAGGVGTMIGKEIGEGLVKPYTEIPEAAPEAPTPTAPTPPAGVPRGIIIPEYSGAVPADIYKRIAQLYPDLSNTQIRGLAHQIDQASGAPTAAPAPAPQAAGAPAAAAPATAPAAAPAAPPEAAAAPEAAPAAAPTVVAPEVAPIPKAAPPAPKLPDHNAVAQSRGFDDEAHVIRQMGVQGAKDWFSREYSQMTRAKAAQEGRVVGTDRTELEKRGIDPTGMSYADAQEALREPEAAAPSTVTEQLKSSLAETPTPKPTLADMNAAIDKANLPPEIENRVRAKVKFYMKKGDAESIRAAQQVLDEALPEAAKPTRQQQASRARTTLVSQ